MTSVHYVLAMPLVGSYAHVPAAEPHGLWGIEPVPLMVLLGSALLYAWGIRRLSLRGRSWPWKRTVPFCGGLVLIGIATQTPLASFDTRLFSAHVVQHLLLSMAAPALLCLGAPVTLALQAADRPVQRTILRLLHMPISRMITFPLVSWVLFVGSLFVLYYSGLYELSLRNELFHELVHMHFIMVGFLFFAPVVSIDPHPWGMPHGARLLYVGLTLPAHAFLALALLSATTPLALDWYLAVTSFDQGQILRDQKTGAALMWVAGDLIAISTVAIVVTQWAKQEDRVSIREDRYVDESSHPTSV